MIIQKTSKQFRVKRLGRIRTLLKGTDVRPRLTVFKSHRAMSVQAVDDSNGRVLFSVRKNGKTIKDAIELGKDMAILALKKGVKRALFDRSGYRYHGAVKALADAVREGGIKI
jgi:large subunit ribosomal protein L18